MYCKQFTFAQVALQGIFLCSEATQTGFSLPEGAIGKEQVNSTCHIPHLPPVKTGVTISQCTVAVVSVPSYLVQVSSIRLMTDLVKFPLAFMRAYTSSLL